MVNVNSIFSRSVSMLLAGCLAVGPVSAELHESTKAALPTLVTVDRQVFVVEALSLEATAEEVHPVSIVNRTHFVQRVEQTVENHLPLSRSETRTGLMTRGQFLVGSLAFLVEVACSQLPPTRVDPGFIKKVISLLSLLPHRRPGTTEIQRAFTMVQNILTATRASSSRMISQTVPGVGRTYTALAVPAIGKAAGNIIVSAHVDSMSPGADDNASGVAALLEIARLVSHHPSRYNFYFVFTGDEERNHAGVKTFIKDMESQEVRADNSLVINLDSIGQSTMKSSEIPSAERQARIWLTEATLKAPHPSAFSPILQNSPLPLRTDDPEIVSNIEEGQSDAALFAIYGFPAITVSGLSRNQSRPAGILHTERDTPRRVNIDAVAATAQWLSDRLILFGSNTKTEKLPAGVTMPPPPQIQLPPQVLLKDVTADTIRLFASHGIHFIPQLPVGAAELEFLRIWLEYIAERWPNYRQHFKVFDNRLTETNEAYALFEKGGKGGGIQYGFPLGLSIIRSRYTADPKIGLAYYDRQIVLTHEIGHIATDLAAINPPPDFQIGFGGRHFRNTHELFATDFAFMLLYNELTTGLFVGSDLEIRDMGTTIAKTVTAVDLNEAQPERRSLIEQIFSKIGVQPMKRPFPIARTDIRNWLPNVLYGGKARLSPSNQRRYLASA